MNSNCDSKQFWLLTFLKKILLTKYQIQERKQTLRPVIKQFGYVFTLDVVNFWKVANFYLLITFIIYNFLQTDTLT